MANPRVRPYLQFYPEDSEKRVDEYWQASHWREEVDPDRLTPMAIIHQQHFFVYEPCLLQDGTACMPTRWFYRNKVLVAQAWKLRAVSRELSSGWIVEEFDQIEVSQDLFLVGFETWNSSHSTAGLPSVSQIFGKSLMQLSSFSLVLIFGIGSLTSPDGSLSPWTRTDPAIGNRWRALANGARVYAFPIWLYCDDTSGNLSKKWNKHNSFLFTPAGLPRAHVHREYNVHFLCTSNLAPPLEMLDGVVDQLEYVCHPLLCAQSSRKYTEKAGKPAFGHGTMYIRNACL